MDIDKLRDEIYSWTIEHSDEIGIDTTLCIGEGVEKHQKYLCLLLRDAKNPQGWSTRQQNQACEL